MPYNEKGEFIRSPARTDPTTASTQPTESISRDDLLTVAKGLGALVLLAGLIWFVVVFREWITIGLGLWLVSSLLAWLR